MKRVFDIVLSVLLIVLLSPVLLVTAILVRFKLGAPIFFKQERAGFQGKPFVIYKFRTMCDHRDAQGKLLPDDQRLRSFGMLLRKYSLDELPQLRNVLNGDMSFVGPRPLLMEYLPLYSKEQARRHEAKPGITGWCQVNGRNALTWMEKFKLDVWYVDHASMLLDLKILFMTFYKVFSSQDVSQENHVSMPKFEGNKKDE